MKKKADSGTTDIPDLEMFPVIGIGASAGGLDALEKFLSNTAGDSGMAYVVIQHLDPTQKGMLPELLQRVTAMKVHQVKNRMEVVPDSVYVIPPNRSMTISKNKFRIFTPSEDRAYRLPVDLFLRSLAIDRQDTAIGVILSGMGSDGSAGVRMVKERNGIVMVQDPASAQFNSMPQNAINSVPVDIVAPPEELPVQLMRFLKRKPASLPRKDEIKDHSSLERILILLKTVTGNDFSLYKKSTIYRRIERRMFVHNFIDLFSYLKFLTNNTEEIRILFKELLIGVTSFFRDAGLWEYLKNIIIPAIISNQPRNSVFRAWVAGCSTGEEAYSLAIIFKETLEKLGCRGDYSLQIFASDLDNEAIETARKGFYNVNIAADVSPERLKRFFTKSEDGYRVNTEIREMIVFAHHNITMQPPFTRMDLISCRNLLIYLNPELQKKIVELFYYSLRNNGFLIMGGSETVGNNSKIFSALDSKLKVYRRGISVQKPNLYEFPSSGSRNLDFQHEKRGSDDMNIQSLTDQLLLQSYSPPGVLVNENGDILYISGHTGKYLEPSVGKANMNIFAMLREGIRAKFPVAFRKVIVKKESAVLPGIKIHTNGSSQLINVNIQWIEKPLQLKGMILITFVDTAGNTLVNGDKDKRTVTRYTQKELEDELQRTREEMQNTLEEMQTSQEELKSANEELQSTNEELQSTNEELTTSKEEMQSLNEELQTVNAELQTKVDDYVRVNNDMKNLLNSTDIATLFLDKDLNIRRFTNQATKIFKFIQSDIGRPFTDQVSDLIYPDLDNDAQEVLRSLIFIQKPIPTRDGRWFNIRIMPYRTYDDHIDGLVLTFINITDFKLAENKLIEEQKINRFLFRSLNAAFRLSSDLLITDFNEAARELFGNKPVTGQNFVTLMVSEAEQKNTTRYLMNLKGKKKGLLRTSINNHEGHLQKVVFDVLAIKASEMKLSGLILTLRSK